MKTTTATLGETDSILSESKRSASFEPSEGTAPEPYIHSQISLTEYRILNSHTAEIPTLTQSRLLAAVLERQRIKAERQARQQAIKLKAVAALKQALLHPWQSLGHWMHLDLRRATAGRA